MENQITCPHCRHDFPLDQLMAAQITDKIRGELDAEYTAKTQALVAERAELESTRKQLAESQQQLDKQIAETLAKERKKIEQDAHVKAKQVVAVELKDRETQISEAAARLKEFEQREIDLRKSNRQLEARAEQNELDIARKLDEERKKIRTKALAQAAEENQLKLAEKDLAIESMKKKIDELRQKAEQGSQQIQGEVQELALEALLPAEFPGDVIKPVGKGVRGADVLQQVYDTTGRECGSILWESKRTKNWQDGWLTKLMDDQQEAKASCVCIVSSALPAEVQHFGEVNGVWVASWTCVRSAAMALRHALIETARARRATEGQHGKMELVYNYISSGEFALRVKGIVSPYIEMQADLESEKRAFNRQWNKRQKQLDRAIASTTGLFGDLQGIVGNGLQEIEGIDALAIEASVNDHVGENLDGDLAGEPSMPTRDAVATQRSTD